MKILMIGGTGTISSAITRQLAQGGHDLWLLNRGTRRKEVPAGVKQVICDVNDEEESLSPPLFWKPPYGGFSVFMV